MQLARSWWKGSTQLDGEGIGQMNGHAVVVVVVVSGGCMCLGWCGFGAKFWGGERAFFRGSTGSNQWLGAVVDLGRSTRPRPLATD